jgi:hypothetical protein
MFELKWYGHRKVIMIYINYKSVIREVGLWIVQDLKSDLMGILS